MKKLMIISVALMVAACSGNNRMSNGQMIGAVGGGLLGGYVGSHFGSGAGNILFMVVGTTVGAAAGYSFGSTLLPSDRSKFENSTQLAMDNVSDGQLLNWTNADTGVAGTITPLKTYYSSEGYYCRDFDATIAAKEGVGAGKGRACRAESGSWLIDNRV